MNEADFKAHHGHNAGNLLVFINILIHVAKEM